MGISTRTIIPAKLAGSTVLVTFDFTSLLAATEEIETATVTVQVYSGTDPNFGDILEGDPAAGDAIVTQMITGGVLGVIYILKCLATTDEDETLEMTGYLAIIPDVP